MGQSHEVLDDEMLGVASVWFTLDAVQDPDSATHPVDKLRIGALSTDLGHPEVGGTNHCQHPLTLIGLDQLDRTRGPDTTAVSFSETQVGREPVEQWRKLGIRSRTGNREQQGSYVV